jgi:hypothetical protein
MHLTITALALKPSLLSLPMERKEGKTVGFATAMASAMDIASHTHVARTATAGAAAAIV